MRGNKEESERTQWQYVACALYVGHQRPQIHIQNTSMQYSSLFYFNNSRTNAPQCYVTGTIARLALFTQGSMLKSASCSSYEHTSVSPELLKFTHLRGKHAQNYTQNIRALVSSCKRLSEWDSGPSVIALNMQVVRTHVPPPSSLSGCLSEMQVLLDCLRPLRRAHFTRTEVKIVVQTWPLIWSGPYTSLRPLGRMSRDNVHLHPKQSHYHNQISIAKILHTQKIRSLIFRSNRPYGKHSGNTRRQAMYVQN